MSQQPMTPTFTPTTPTFAPLTPKFESQPVQQPPVAVVQQPSVAVVQQPLFVPGKPWAHWENINVNRIQVSDAKISTNYIEHTISYAGRPFLIDAPLLTSYRGITSYSGKSNANDHNISFKFDFTNEEHKRFYKVCADIIMHIVKLLQAKNVDTIDMTAFINRDGDKYYKAKCESRGMEPSLFTTPSRKPIDWSVIKDVRCEMLPIFRISRVFLGNPDLSGRTIRCIQSTIFNTIVYDIGLMSYQDNINNEELEEKVEAQMAASRARQQNYPMSLEPKMPTKPIVELLFDDQNNEESTLSNLEPISRPTPIITKTADAQKVEQLETQVQQLTTMMQQLMQIVQQQKPTQ